MTELTIRTLCVGAGFLLGIVTGIVVNERRAARRRGDAGAVNWQSTATGVALGLIVLVVAVSSFRSEQVVRDVRAQGDCSARILSATVMALNERTTFSEPTADATDRIRLTQAALVDALLDRAPAAEQERLAALYRSAIADGIRLSNAQEGKRATYPYPTAQQIVTCYQP